MTATQAGSPAMEPEGGDPSVAAPDVVSVGSADATTVSPAEHGQDEGGSNATARIAALRARLMTPMPDDRLWGWLGPLLVTAFAAFFRFYRLGIPHAVIFDETYYAKDAWSILQHGVEWQFTKNANDLILAGQHGASIFTPCAGTGCGEYVVQPPVGKLLIAVGEWMFGLTPFGWRFASAVIGTLAVLVMCRVARRLTRSTLLGCMAGLLMALDGLEFVLSRTGILDIFLMFFVLAAFGCLVVDRDVSRSRLAQAVVLDRYDDAGPALGIRKWRVAAGVLIGLACGSKQDAVWYIFAFAGLAIAWDIGARRAAGLRDYVRGALVRDGKWLPLTLGVIPLVTYIATWSGWLITSTGYDRNYASQNGVHFPVISALYSLYEYHKEMVQFGVSLSSTHPYMSQPWGWIVLSRPVAFWATCYTSPAATQVCPKVYNGPQYWGEVTSLGNPAIWWVAIPAMLFCLGWWLTRRDWRAGAALLCVAAGWLTWLPFMVRTKFDYYSLEFEPFLILCIVLCLGLIIGRASASLRRRAAGAIVAGIYVLAVLVLFWYFYPVTAYQIIPYSDWIHHMWYHGWI
jgi:dolichyl-phosphate-mannose--protein O-mannosyl transferase